MPTILGRTPSGRDAVGAALRLYHNPCVRRLREGRPGFADPERIAKALMALSGRRPDLYLVVDLIYHQGWSEARVAAALHRHHRTIARQRAAALAFLGERLLAGDGGRGAGEAA